MKRFERLREIRSLDEVDEVIQDFGFSSPSELYEKTGIEPKKLVHSFIVSEQDLSMDENELKQLTGMVWVFRPVGESVALTPYDVVYVGQDAAIYVEDLEDYGTN